MSSTAGTGELTLYLQACSYGFDGTRIQNFGFLHSSTVKMSFTISDLY